MKAPEDAFHTPAPDPPLVTLIVPDCALTVPGLLKATALPIDVAVPADLVNVPLLVTNWVPHVSGQKMDWSLETVKVPPATLLNPALLRIVRLPVPAQVPVPELIKTVAISAFSAAP